MISATIFNPIGRRLGTGSGQIGSGKSRSRRHLLIPGKATATILPKYVTEITYGNDVHRRVGAAIGVGVVTLGIGAMLLLVKTKKHYVGIIWDGTQDGKDKGGMVFKVGKGEYRGFISGLEGLTGKKAVNADIAKVALDFPRTPCHAAITSSYPKCNPQPGVPRARPAPPLNLPSRL